MPQAAQYLPSRRISPSKIAWTLAIICSTAFSQLPRAHAQTLTTLYDFAGEPDGATPYANVIRDAAGNLYGTTGHGGTTNNGTVFAIDSQGGETIIHSFGGPPDGGGPFAGLLRWICDVLRHHQ
jgi:uncharacterized repeat protein (TIGR03803 family)